MGAAKSMPVPQVSSRPPPAAAPRPARTAAEQQQRAPQPSSHEEHAAHQKRIVIRPAVRLPWRVPLKAKYYQFLLLPQGWDVAPWPLGAEPPEQFASRLYDARVKFVRSPRLTVMFQMDGKTCARRVFVHGNGFSLSRIVSAIHSTACSAAVLDARDAARPGQAMTQAHLDDYLARRVVRCIYIMADRVYAEVFVQPAGRDDGARAAVSSTLVLRKELVPRRRQVGGDEVRTE